MRRFSMRQGCLIEKSRLHLSWQFRIGREVFSLVTFFAPKKVTRAPARKSCQALHASRKHQRQQLHKNSNIDRENHSITSAAAPAPAKHDRAASAAHWRPDADDALGIHRRKSLAHQHEKDPRLCPQILKRHQMLFKQLHPSSTN